MDAFYNLNTKQFNIYKTNQFMTHVQVQKAMDSLKNLEHNFIPFQRISQETTKEK